MDLDDKVQSKALIRHLMVLSGIKMSKIRGSML